MPFSLKDSGMRRQRFENRNYIINGGMEVAQRNPNFVRTACVNNTYQMADRWRTLFSLTSGTAPDIYSSNGFGNLPGGSRYAAAIYSNAGVGKTGIFQVIESYNMHDLRGAMVSLQARLSEFGSLNNLYMGIMEWTGTIDATTSDPIQNWNAAGSLPTLNTGWEFVGTPKVFTPSTVQTRCIMEGYGPVSSSANNMGVLIWADDTTSIVDESAFIVTDVKLEKGTYCTDFVLDDFATELMKCQRYYQKSFAQGTPPVQNLASGPGAASWIGTGGAVYNTSCYVKFPVVMRSVPTLTFYNPHANNTKWGNLSAAADSGMDAGSSNVSDNGFLVYGSAGTTPSSGQVYGIHWTAAIEL